VFDQFGGNTPVTLRFSPKSADRQKQGPVFFQADACPGLLYAVMPMAA
jgi:hypothetical protein